MIYKAPNPLCIECSRRIRKIYIRTIESKQIRKAREKAKSMIFRLLLNESGYMEYLITKRRLFHEVDRTGMSFCRFGTTREPELDERKDLTGVYS